ncbi:MAG: oxidoreductase [Burkholderiaceae bacterium]|nr:oxidoreductase [Burkholderiaceae bacterium]
MQRTLTQRDFDRFAALSHDDNPIHCDPAFARGTHFGATVAHGMFLYGLICAALSRRLARPWLPASQTLMFPAPTWAGDRVSVRAQPHPSCRVFDVGVSVMRDGHNVDTAIGESGVSFTTTPVPVGRSEGAPLAGETALAHDAEAAMSTDRSYVAALETSPVATLPFGLRPGQCAAATRRFLPRDLDEYAELCGDMNPLVVDDAAAWRAGLSGRLVPGPLLSGMFSDLLGTRLPGRGTGWMKQSLRFVRPVHPGQLLQAAVEIVRVRPDKQLVDLRSTVRDGDGALVVDGVSLVLVRNLERAPG